LAKKLLFALDGIKVLSFAYLYPGPYCTMFLADMGAEVIVAEPPTGDPARRTPGYLSQMDRNKKSIVLNLKTDEGKEICYDLARNTDVFVEGFRPGIAKKLGVDYGTIKKFNPKIIYCSITAFGQDGPNWDRPAHDLTLQGVAGLLVNSPSDPPIFPNIAIADVNAGLLAANAILIALVGRQRHHRGDYIDIAMADGLLSLMGVSLGRYFANGEYPTRTRAGYGIFKTKDGRYLTLSIAAEDHFWQSLCSIFKWEDVKDMNVLQRREAYQELNTKISEIIVTRTIREWEEVFTKNDIPWGPVLSLEEVVKDPHFLSRGMIQELTDITGNKEKQLANPIKFSGYSSTIRSLQPELGEHTVEVLKKLGYSSNKIAMLKEKGAV